MGYLVHPLALERCRLSRTAASPIALFYFALLSDSLCADSRIFLARMFSFLCWACTCQLKLLLLRRHQRVMCYATPRTSSICAWCCRSTEPENLSVTSSRFSRCSIRNIICALRALVAIASPCAVLRVPVHTTRGSHCGCE